MDFYSVLKNHTACLQRSPTVSCCLSSLLSVLLSAEARRVASVLLLHRSPANYTPGRPARSTTFPTHTFDEASALTSVLVPKGCIRPWGRLAPRSAGEAPPSALTAAIGGEAFAAPPREGRAALRCSAWLRAANRAAST